MAEEKRICAHALCLCFFFFLQIDKIYVERSESIELLCLLSVDEKGGKNKTRTELKKRGKKGRAQNEGTVHIADPSEKNSL